MNRRLKILIVGTSFSPAYGGPARSVSKLAVEIEKAGLKVGVWSPDGSVLGTQFIPPYSGVKRLGGAFNNALEQFGACDLVHDNGVWLRHNHEVAKVASRLNIPRVVSTRGMLEPWALNSKKWKKKMAWYLYQYSDLKKACVLHATSEAEVTQLRRLGLTNRISQIPNGVDIPQIPDAGTEESNPYRTILFLGRIQEKKGLLNLVKAWREVKKDGWRIRVIGPDENNHLAEVRASAAEAGVISDISFEGPLGEEEKWAAYGQSDLFILPSHSENFGIVVAEALASGTPVITTKGAPWEGLVDNRCGWWTEISSDGVASALKDAMSRSPQELKAMGDRGREWVRRDFGWGSVTLKILKLYKSLSM